VATAVSTAVRSAIFCAHADRTLRLLRLRISSAASETTVCFALLSHMLYATTNTYSRCLRTNLANTCFPIVDFETFSKILNRPGGFREPFDIEEYIRGFQVFDKDRSGFVGKGQIKYILTNLGEKMSEEEVDELFKSTIDASNNEVDYRGKFFFSLSLYIPT